MEYSSGEILHDTNENNMRNEVDESDYTKMNVQVERNPGSSENVLQVKIVDSKSGENIVQGGANEDMDTSGEVNMEASITPDDVIRAGGFGARDDISSFLPVASDSTDFEASLRDARDYEEPQGYTDQVLAGQRLQSQDDFCYYILSCLELTLLVYLLLKL